MAQKWVTEEELNYMKMGGKVVYAQEGATAQGGEDQVMQLIQAYAQEAGIDPEDLINQLQQMSPEEQQQAIQNMAQELQGGAEGQEQNQSPQEEQAEMQGGGQEEMMQQIAQAIQQGTDPQELIGALIQQGASEEEAGQMIQAIAQQMQGAPQMVKGGMVSPEKAREILHDGTVHGKPLTDKQRKFFGAMANKSEDGNTIVNFDSAYTTQTAPIARNPLYRNSGTVDGENTKYPFRQEHGGTAFYDEYRQDATQKLIQGGNLHTYEGKNIKAEKGKNIKTTWDQYRTKLNKTEEKDYSAWKKNFPERLQSDKDYDLKGFFKEFGKEPIPQGEDFHLVDKYKLPNHATFSSESKYYNPETESLGGNWMNRGDKWVYSPNSEAKQTVIEYVPNEEIRRNFMHLGRPGVRRSDFTWNFSNPYSMKQGGYVEPHGYNIHVPGPELMGRRKDYLMDANYAYGGNVPEGYHVMPSGRLMSDAEHKPNGNVGQQDLKRFMTGNVSIQGGQGARYAQDGDTVKKVSDIPMQQSGYQSYAEPHPEAINKIKQSISENFPTSLYKDEVGYMYNSEGLPTKIKLPGKSKIDIVKDSEDYKKALQLRDEELTKSAKDEYYNSIYSAMENAPQGYVAPEDFSTLIKDLREKKAQGQNLDYYDDIRQYVNAPKADINSYISKFGPYNPQVLTNYLYENKDKYQTGGLVPGGMLVGDKQYYPYGGYVERNSEGGAPSYPSNRAEWLSYFGSAYPTKAQYGLNPTTNSFKNLDPNKAGYDFSSTSKNNPYLTAAKPIESQTNQKNLLTSPNKAVTNAQQAQAKQEMQPTTPQATTALPTTNAAQTAPMPTATSPETRNYKGALEAGVTNIDEFMRYKRTGNPNPVTQMQEYGGYTMKAQDGITTFNPYNQMPGGYQGVTIPQYGQGFGDIGINYQNVANGPQGGVGINTVNLQQGSPTQGVGIKGTGAKSSSKGLGIADPVSMGLGVAGGAMDATAQMLSSLGKEGSKAQAFGQGASNAMNIAGMATAPFKDIPVIGQALDAVGKTLGFLIGGPLAARQAAIRSEEEDKAKKQQQYYERTTPTSLSTQGTAMAKYGKNVRNMKQRMIDDIYNDFDKYMKK